MLYCVAVWNLGVKRFGSGFVVFHTVAKVHKRGQRFQYYGQCNDKFQEL